MKIIGIGDGRETTYICEVRHSEIEKFLGLYYGNMKPLKVGSDVDLGKGYDFMRDTTSALKKTEEFITENKKVIDAIFIGIQVMSQRAVEQENV